MKWHQAFSGVFAKLRAALRLERLRDLVATPVGRLRTAFQDWRARRRGLPPDDVSHTFSARRYPGSRTRRYVVHLPHGNIGSRPRPLVVVLHGCRQDNRDIEQITGFNELSDRHGFLVAYPFITSYRGLRNRNCWGWWFDREIHAGAGEVEDLWQIVEEIKQQYPVDERRIHVTGLSSGGGMTVAMLVAHAGKIASGAAVAGLPYAEKAEAVRHEFNTNPRNRPVISISQAMRAEMGPDARAVPIQIIHSYDDDKVDINSALILRDSWGHCFGIDTRSAFRVRNGETGGTCWEQARYRDDGRKAVIETLFMEGPGHGWYGGKPGRYSFTDAPDISASIWKFFAAHPLERRRKPRVKAA